MTRAAAERMCGCRDCFARGGAAWPIAPESWRNECCANALILFAAQAIKEERDRLLAQAKGEK